MGAIGIAAAMSESMKTAATAAANMRNLLEAIFLPSPFLLVIPAERRALDQSNRRREGRGAIKNQ
jgi:hypothetical protein